MGQDAHENVWETVEIHGCSFATAELVRMYKSSSVRPSTITAFNVEGLSKMKKIYCKCGRIIGLDYSQMKLKLALGKELECTECRNARIAKDIDELNDHFNGIIDDEF